MKINKILLAALVGGIAYFFLGWLVYGILFFGVFAPPPEVMAVIEKKPMEMWAMVVSCLAWGLLLAVIFGRWANISTLKTGAIAGAVIGLLISIAVDLSMYSMYTFMTFQNTIFDIIANSILMGITGGIVGWILGRGASK